MACYTTGPDPFDVSQFQDPASFSGFLPLDALFDQDSCRFDDHDFGHGNHGTGALQMQDMFDMESAAQDFSLPHQPFARATRPQNLHNESLDSASSSQFTTPVEHNDLPYFQDTTDSWGLALAASTGLGVAEQWPGDYGVKAAYAGSFKVDPSSTRLQVQSLDYSPVPAAQFDMRHLSRPSSGSPPATTTTSAGSPVVWTDVLTQSQPHLSSSRSRSRSPVFRHHNMPAPSCKHSAQSFASQCFPESVGDGTIMQADDDGRERSRCPHAGCGKPFKDLKAHMLTHQTERPEKCPIESCDFHKRGFARKYDRNRHLVTTHYKQTITCGFCVGEGTPMAKTFNRTDVFKRHMVTAHGVDQNALPSKRRTSRGVPKHSIARAGQGSGKCSTCGTAFATPEELFEHLDECILNVVTRKDPGESANEENLRMVEGDADVLATMTRHSLAPCSQLSSSPSVMGDLDEDEPSTKCRKRNNGSHPASDKAQSQMFDYTRAGNAGLTFSKGGRDLIATRGGRRRKDYPQSWNCPMDDLTLKKRVLCVFDGQRRLWKDDMMLGNQFEARVQLPDGGFVSDFDVAALKRAEAIHNATPEERGPDLATNYYHGQLPAHEVVS